METISVLVSTPLKWRQCPPHRFFTIRPALYGRSFCLRNRCLVSAKLCITPSISKSGSITPHSGSNPFEVIGKLAETLIKSFNALEKTAIVAVFLGLLLAYDPCSALAVSGGRMGGSCFSSDSSTSSSSSSWSSSDSSSWSSSSPYSWSSSSSYSDSDNESWTFSSPSSSFSSRYSSSPTVTQPVNPELSYSEPQPQMVRFSYSVARHVPSLYSSLSSGSSASSHIRKKGSPGFSYRVGQKLVNPGFSYRVCQKKRSPSSSLPSVSSMVPQTASPGFSDSAQSASDVRANTILLIIFVGFAVVGFKALLSDGNKGPTAAIGKTSVLKLQVGLSGMSRSLQQDLNRIAETADTSTSRGLSYVLTEATLALLRHQGFFISCYLLVNLKLNMEDVEERFNKLCIEERAKFDEETLVNVNNFKRKNTASQRGNGLSNKYMVVTILVAAKGVHEVAAIYGSGGDLKEALQKLGAIPMSKILAVEVLWAPQNENDTLSESQLVKDYPFLKPL